MQPLVVAFQLHLQVGILALMETSDTAGSEEKKSRGFHVRIPPELRKRIDDARKISGRSVNAELLARIEASLDADEPDLISTIQSLKASVDALNKRLDEK